MYLKHQLKALNLIPLGLTTTTSATDAGTKKKKKFGSGRLPDLNLRNITLIVSNEEINDVMKIIKYLEESGLLIKHVSETIKNKAKVQKKQISQYVIRYIMC